MDWMYSNSWQGSNQAFMENNARVIYGYLYAKGWTLNAVCGLLGNMQRESALNPHQKEFVSGREWDIKRDGYGLGGWTPGQKIIDYVKPKGMDYRTGNSQMYYLVDYSEGWGNSGDPGAPSVIPPLSWEEYQKSTLDVSTLADYYMWYWEKPSYDPVKQDKSGREQNAINWYKFFEGVDPPLPPKPDPPVIRKLPIYMMLRHY